MRLPLSWLREYVDAAGRADAPERSPPAGPRSASRSRQIDGSAPTVGPVRGRPGARESRSSTAVKKTIRWCQVDVGEPAPRGIVCGARNFAVGDLVVVALPGAVLPGGFAITARKTYGHVSDGMICSAARARPRRRRTPGILVLPPDMAPLGADAVELLHLRDDVLDIAITPDRGYALSMRGVARERCAPPSTLPFRDPADACRRRRRTATGWPVRDRRPDRLRPVRRRATSPGSTRPRRRPLWMPAPAARWPACGSISLAVDVTNYVMLELGQPLHAFDRARLHRPDRRAAGPAGGDAGDPGRRRRATLDPDDLLITDDSRADRAGRHRWAALDDRDRAEHHRRGASRPRTSQPATIARGVPPAQAAQRGVQAVRARRRPGAAAGRGAGPGRARCWPSSAAADVDRGVTRSTGPARRCR